MVLARVLHVMVSWARMLVAGLRKWALFWSRPWAEVANEVPGAGVGVGVDVAVN